MGHGEGVGSARRVGGRDEFGERRPARQVGPPGRDLRRRRRLPRHGRRRRERPAASGGTHARAARGVHPPGVLLQRPRVRRRQTPILLRRRRRGRRDRRGTADAMRNGLLRRPVTIFVIVVGTRRGRRVEEPVVDEDHARVLEVGEDVLEVEEPAVLVRDGGEVVREDVEVHELLGRVVRARGVPGGGAPGVVDDAPRVGARTALRAPTARRAAAEEEAGDDEGI
mmetsp:Transcript_11884/g.47922  ORF Transcript_11884/g.47922 Transcript_11884/m.47922 type:complete len:225 (+) Transcript_11884:384-1058(+)